MRRLLTVLFFFITSVMLIAGFLFEEASGNRQVLLTVLVITFLVLLLACQLIEESFWPLNGILLVMSLLLAAMELNSQFAVNYFFHSLYILIALYILTRIPTRRAVVAAVFVMLLSMVKFVQLVTIEQTFANVAVLVFFLSVQVLVTVTGVFLKIYQQESEKNKQLYEELLTTHNQLRAYAGEIRSLSQMEMRTQIARDLHDTLGHDMTALIMQLELMGHSFENHEHEEGFKRLSMAKESARGSLVKVREIVDTLKNSDDGALAVASIESLVSEFSLKTGCRVSLNYKGGRQLGPKAGAVLYRIIQESLTNSLRHGQATEIVVKVEESDDQVHVIIEDNGKGCDQLTYGNGLSGMKARVDEVGGVVSVTGQPVFRVECSLPK